MFNLLKDVVKVFGIINEDENPLTVDGRSSLSKLSVVNRGKTQA